ncbi:primosomal protein [Vibrio sp. 10N.247.311.51]|uniref:primosomal protein n=1 Tax=Vibrio sp. 10N.247.311.51 TaxID=3229996 RepID=UPI003552718B
MKTKKEKHAHSAIMDILLMLNAIEARNVIEAICQDLGQKAPAFQKRKGRLSKIELDRDLYEFILSLDLEFMAQRDVLNACIDEFGKERSPSKTGLNRAFSNNLFSNK